MNELTVKEFAALERVTERTVRNWIAKGALQIRRTPGGAIRIADRRSAPRGIMTPQGIVMANDEMSGNLSK